MLIYQIPYSSQNSPHPLRQQGFYLRFVKPDFRFSGLALLRDPSIWPGWLFPPPSTLQWPLGGHVLLVSLLLCQSLSLPLSPLLASYLFVLYTWEGPRNENRTLETILSCRGVRRAAGSLWGVRSHEMALRTLFPPRELSPGLVKRCPPWVSFSDSDTNPLWGLRVEVRTLQAQSRRLCIDLYSP